MEIPKMRAPGEKGVIQVIITNRCDLLKCSNCTQMLMHQHERWSMTFENFQRAIDSLAQYPGIIGVFGGNPCIHPEFEKFSEYFALAIPEKRRRGLWSNNINGHGKTIERVYGYFNLNVHTHDDHAAEMKSALPGVKVWGEHKRSWHSPTMVAIQDVITDEAKMWAAIAKCDINLNWSGAVTQRAGELKAYFCEVAAAFEGVYPEINTGLEVTPGWWRRPIDDYAAQVDHWCRRCGVPLKMKGQIDLDFTDDISKTHEARVALTVGGKRKIVIHDSIDTSRTHEVTDYMELRK